MGQAEIYYWDAVDTDVLEDSARKMSNMVKRLAKEVKSSDAYRGLDKYVKDFALAVPLLTSLRHPSMRERHWQELFDVTGVSFKLPGTPEASDLQLRDLLACRLHTHAAAVEEITDKAVKESKHEVALAAIAKSWKSIDYGMTPYAGNKEVPLLKMMDEDIETLEADLMALQGIVTSRYVFYRKEAVEHQQALIVVSDVYSILIEIQRMWAYLEPLFMKSDEVRRELPESAAKFEVVDGTVRDALAGMWLIKNVREGCNMFGLLEQLEEMQTEQELCRKSLADFMDGKRRTFPRFYFTSEADLLDILSNGSKPRRILRHVSSVMLATKVRSGPPRDIMTWL